MYLRNRKLLLGEWRFLWRNLFESCGVLEDNQHCASGGTFWHWVAAQQRIQQDRLFVSRSAF
jgi:hypothetical protein